MQKETERPGPGLAQTLDWVAAVTIVWATAFYPFLRYGMGTHALSWLGPFALIFMVLYADAARCPLIWPYIVAWLIACVVQRCRARKDEHSKFLGYPLVCALPFVRSEMAGRVVEGLLVTSVGVAVAPLGGAAANFFWFGGLAMLVRVRIDQAVLQKRLRTIRDAAIEQRVMSELLRKMQ